MWRHFGRWSWRILLGLVLLILMVSLPLLTVLGSEAGSRWLIEKALGVQSALTLKIEGGTILSGLAVSDVQLHGKKFDLFIGRAVARWSLVGLLRATIEVEDLQADKLKLTLKGPSSPDPVTLPRLVLPLRLVIRHVELREAGIEKGGNYWGLAHAELQQGQWRGSRVDIGRLEASHALGHVALSGHMRLIGQYDISTRGELTLAEFERQGLSPLHVSLDRHLGSLLIAVTSEGRLPLQASATLQTLTPDLPFNLTANWKTFHSPWLTQQELATQGGEVQVIGSLKGLKSTGRAQFSGLHIPSGVYRWRGDTDWHDANIDEFVFTGLGGEARLNGQVGWGNRLHWNARASFSKLAPAQKWPFLQLALPEALSGTLESRGDTSDTGSSLTAALKLDSGESWQLATRAASRPWNLRQPQQASVLWEGVVRNVPGLGQVQSQAGKLEAEGSLQQYRLQMEADLASAKTPQGKWRLKAAGNSQQMQVDYLDYDGSIGSATAAGQLAFGKELRWEGSLTTNQLQTGWLLPEWAGTLDAAISGQGVWGVQNKDINLDDIHVTGQLRQQPLLLEGGARLSLPLRQGDWPRLMLNHVAATWGRNTLNANGGLASNWDLSVDADIQQPEVLDSRLAGMLTGQVNITGQERQPSVTTLIKGQELGFAGYHLQTLQLDGRISDLGYGASQLNLLADGLHAFDRTIDSVAMTLAGNREDHEFSWLVKSPEAQAQGRLHGGVDLATLGWQGELEVAQLQLPGMLWVLDQPAELAWEQASMTAHVGAHCWSSGDARLCNEEELVAGPEGHAKLRLTGLDASRLQKLLPEGLNWKGEITGNGDARWSRGEQPAFSVNLLSRDGRVALDRDEGAPLELGYNLVAIQAFIRPEDWRMRFDLLSPDMGNGYLDVTLDPRISTRPLDGRAALTGMRLDVLQPFFPALAVLTGELSADGRIGGNLQAPEYWGSIALDKGQVIARDAPLNLSNIGIQVNVQGQRADIGGSLMSGSGKATLKGDAQWSNSWGLNLALEGNNLEVRQEPMVVALLSPSLSLAVVPNVVSLKGQVRVPDAKITIESLPEKAVPLSSDVRIVEVDDGKAQAQLQTASRAWAINADVEVLLGQDVRFIGFGVNGRLNGNLRLQQQDKRGLQAMGEVQLDEKESRYDAYGQRLNITRGRLLFAGSLTQPGVDIEASKEVEGKLVGIRVNGRANAPEVTFFSDSGLSQEETISYLVLGRPLYKDGQLNQGDGSTANLALAAAAIKLGSKGGGQDLANQIGGVFGIQDIALDAEGTGDDTQFTVSGYLNPKLYLSYGVGVFTPVNTVKVRYTINRRLYLQAMSSLENALDVYYNFKF